MTVTIFHREDPTFGLLDDDDEPHDYRQAATATFPESVDHLSVLDRVFRMTNTIEEPWTDLASTNGLTIPIDGQQRPLPQRSTSVGDVVKIVDWSGETYYVCAPAGWKTIDAESIFVAPPATGTRALAPTGLADWNRG